jgi:hypothetical protein
MIEYDQIKKDNIHFTHWRWENDCEREEWGHVNSTIKKPWQCFNN